MSWLAALGAGACAAPLTGLIAGTTAALIADWMRLPNREGALGFFAVAMTILGALVGLLLAVALSRGWFGIAAGFGKSLGLTVGSVLVLSLLLTGLARLTADRGPTVDGRDQPPRSLTPAEQDAADDAEQEAKMRALAPDAPLAEWLVFTRYGVPETRVAHAVAAIRARPMFVAEMTELMTKAEGPASHDAFRSLAHMQPPPTELGTAVATAGQRIARSLRELDPAAEQPNYPSASNLSNQFSAWIEAAIALQGKDGLDFVPQLQEIIEPARNHPESHVLRIDVARVASFYLQQWGGIAPLPTDPPPR